MKIVAILTVRPQFVKAVTKSINNKNLDFNVDLYDSGMASEQIISTLIKELN